MKRINEIYRLIIKEYGKNGRYVCKDSVGELIRTVLSQNTSDVNSERAYSALRDRYRSWDMLFKARVSHIVTAIRSGGLADIKAHRIKNILKQIKEKEGRLSLSSLKRLSDEEAFRYLTALDGVGPKTAAVVLLFCFDRPFMPVDTHIFRAAKRIGLIHKRCGPAEAHRILTRITPDEIIKDAHLDLIEHGRRICKAQRPLCEKCVISIYCDYYEVSENS